MKLIYSAHSKHYFFFREHISKYILDQGQVPLNPFMIFSYFMLDSVERNLIREANNTIVRKSDELWVFGPISDGVLVEIKLAESLGKPVRYFDIVNSKDIVEISKEGAKYE